jgi:acyl-CoA synthetase (NDP forming)
MVVISAGFGEVGPEGQAREQALLARARSYGMRIIGPNCMGILNTDPEVKLNATFGPTYPPRGNIALLSQSGALGLALLDYSDKLNIGLFIRQHWQQADVSPMIRPSGGTHTDVILLHRVVRNPRTSRIARRVADVKPIVR